MSMMRWEPFRELMSLREAMDRLFEESFIRPTRLMPGLGGDILVDVYQTPDNVVVKASLPGLKPEEVDISVTGNTLTIKGERKQEREIKEEDYLRREHTYGAFSRSVTLPIPIQADKAEAVFENGILTLTLPKAEEIRPKQIKVLPKAA